MFSSNTSAVSADAVFVEEVFQTHLYTGNGSTQTITNGIDLSGNGGLVWSKGRSVAAFHVLIDTNRGASSQLFSNTTGAAQTGTDLSSFSSTGYVLGAPNNANINANASTYASWTFRKQPKFFDVVTWTGNGTGSRAISHSLASTPGCIILKRTDSADDWWVVHRSASNFGNYAVLNSTAAFTSSINSGISSVGSTSFTVSAYYNSSGATWVAYIFAHNAGGFGLTGTDNVISCGSFTADGSGNATVSLGYEPQFLILKQTNGAFNWLTYDVMRGMSLTNGNPLKPNTSDAESSDGDGYIVPTATGFSIVKSGVSASSSWIYIAIRRGPMKTPTTGTSVFETLLDTAGTGTLQTSTASFPLDMQFNTLYSQTNATYNNQINDRLRGIGFEPSFTTTPHLTTASTAAETTASSYLAFKGNGRDVTKDSGWGSTVKALFYNFRRAPGFFDVVCYTGTGSSSTSFSHNLGVAPELIISKTRSGSTSNWIVTSNFTSTNYLLTALNLTIAGDTYLYTDGASISAQPTSTTLKFTGGVPAVNDSGATYVAYLFASCPGVSKVGSYTGTGNTLQVNCGFTGGARFVLIKRTDSTGDWYVWDSARGIVSGNDPYLLLNSTAAEVTNTDYVDTYSAGFEISSTAPAAINANGGTFVFLAVA